MGDKLLRDRVIGALIGLARATDGNEHLISASATASVLDGLVATKPGTDADNYALEALLGRVEEEKRKMVPDCFLCANPCGRTSDYDLGLLNKADEQIRMLKNRILIGIQRIAAAVPPNIDYLIFYKALVVIGMDDYTAEDLIPVVAEVEELATAL